MSMKPNRQRTPSTESSSSEISSASITRCSTFSRPSSAARRRATSTISDEKSLEIRRPCSPRSGAAAKPVSPGPAASSSTVSPGCGSSACTIHSLTGRVTFSISARRRSQPDAIVCQLSRDVRLYSSRSMATIVDSVGLRVARACGTTYEDPRAHAVRRARRRHVGGEGLRSHPQTLPMTHEPSSSVLEDARRDLEPRGAARSSTRRTGSSRAKKPPWWRRR